MRVKQLGAVVFENNTIFVDESFNPKNVLSEMRMSGAGTHIVYESAINTPYVTLNSMEYSWVTKEQKTALELMWEALGVNYVIIYEDDSTADVRMAREKDLVFTPLSEGSCDFYKVLIPLAKV